MCLYIDWAKTNGAKKNKTGKVVRWKVVLRYFYASGKPVLYSLYHYNYKYKPGWNKSDRPNKTCTGFVCNKGIHVFTSEAYAKSYLGIGQLLLKVICYNKDLVAVGKYHDEVYTKVFLPKDEYDDALKRKGKVRKEGKQNVSIY